MKCIGIKNPYVYQVYLKLGFTRPALYTVFLSCFVHLELPRPIKHFFDRSVIFENKFGFIAFVGLFAYFG